MRESPRSSIRSANIVGGLIQISQVAGAVVFNIVLPRVLGPRDFGLAAAALALPYAVYGALERPVWSALQEGTLKGTVDTARRVSSTVFLPLVLITLVVWAFTPALGDRGVEWASGPLRLASLSLLPMALTLVSLGAAYASSRPQDVLQANVVHGIVLVLGSVTLALGGLGASAPVVGLLLAQISMVMVLGARRALVVPDLAGGRWMVREEAQAMGSTFPVQLPLVVIASLAVPAIAGWLGVEDAAQYRVAVGLMIAAATATPVSPAVVQMTVGELAARCAWNELRRYLTRLAGAGGVSGALWMVFFLVPAPPLLAWLLGSGYTGVTGAMALVGAGCLPWLGMTLSVSVLLGLGGHRLVAVMSSGSAAGSAVVMAVTAVVTRNLTAILGALVVVLWVAALLHAAGVVMLLRSRAAPRA